MAILDTLNEINSKIDLREKHIEAIKVRLCELKEKMRLLKEEENLFLIEFSKLFPQFENKSNDVLKDDKNAIDPMKDYIEGN